jgi:TusA-related sulfurtransferase
MSAIKKLKENEVLKVVAPFIPAPMIEKTLSLEYKHRLVEQSKEEFWVYFKA